MFQRFLSTPSARRATDVPSAMLQQKRISIHALREEGDHRVLGKDLVAVPISIHALREEGDHKAARLTSRATRISIHALREEGDPAGRACCGVESLFLSTPSARRATFGAGSRSCFGRYFYPRPPRGGRHPDTATKVVLYEISIHALREEGDSPIWARTWTTPNFYPRPPRGGRRRKLHDRQQGRKFLSTPSARRATRV